MHLQRRLAMAARLERLQGGAEQGGADPMALPVRIDDQILEEARGPAQREADWLFGFRGDEAEARIEFGVVSRRRPPSA